MNALPLDLALPEGLLDTVVQRLNDMLVITEAEPRFDPGPRIVFVNDAFLRHTGYSREEVIGRSPKMLQGPDTDPEVVRRIGAAMAQWQPIRAELVNYKKNGERYWVEMDIVPIADETGWYTHWVSVERDVTERRSAKRQLQERAQALQAAIRHSSDAIITTDGEGRIVAVNPAAERIFGMEHDSAIGRPLSGFLTGAWRVRPSEPPGVDTPRARSAKPRRMQGLRTDGAVLDLEVTVTEVRVNDQWTVTAYLRDITERTRSERALVRYQLELSSLTQRLLEQEKNLSARMAQALHDQLGQTLTALQLSFDAMQASLPAERARALNDRLQRTEQLIQTAIGEVRTALTDLRPPQLDEFGLLAALRNEVHAHAADSPPHVHLEAPSRLNARRWPQDVEYAVFMIAREAIANARRHANAHRIDVSLDEVDDQLMLTVEDDGVGIRSEDLQSRAGHLGMVGIRERAHAIHAQLSIAALQAGGTEVRVLWRAP